MIRLCAFDLDGTLLDSCGVLSDRNAAALKVLADSGITVALISGRPPCYTEGFFLRIGADGFTAASNGAFISSPAYGILRSSTFSPRLISEVTSLLEKNGARFSIQTREGITGNSPVTPALAVRFVNYCEMTGAFGDGYGLPAADPGIAGKETEGVLKIAVTGGEHPLTEYMALIRSHFPSLSVSFSGDTVLDINLPGNSKGAALREIARMLNVPREDTCSFGDYDNDIPMFTESGLSVAMANATDAVKAVADHITAANDEDGVAEAIYSLILTNDKKEGNP